MSMLALLPLVGSGVVYTDLVSLHGLSVGRGSTHQWEFVSPRTEYC